MLFKYLCSLFETLYRKVKDAQERRVCQKIRHHDNQAAQAALREQVKLNYDTIYCIKEELRRFNYIIEQITCWARKQISSNPAGNIAEYERIIKRYTWRYENITELIQGDWPDNEQDLVIRIEELLESIRRWKKN